MSDTAGPSSPAVSVQGRQTREEADVANPWTKKNPLLSMWLSGANAVAGRARSAGAAEAKRQQTSLIKEAARFWGGDGWPPASPRPRRPGEAPLSRCHQRLDPRPSRIARRPRPSAGPASLTLNAGGRHRPIACKLGRTRLLPEICPPRLIGSVGRTVTAMHHGHWSGGRVVGEWCLWRRPSCPGPVPAPGALLPDV